MFILIGIVSSAYFSLSPLVVLTLLIVCLAGLILFYTFGRSLRMDALWGATFHLICFFTGVFLAQLHKPYSIVDEYPSYSTFVVLVNNAEGENGAYQRYSAELFSVENQIVAKKQLKVRLMIDTAESPFREGEMLYCKGYLNRIKPRGNPGEFDYQTWANMRGIYYSSYCKKGDVTSIGHRAPSIFQRVAVSSREWVIGQFKESGIQGDQLAILTALTTGDKGSLDPELRSSFATAGLMHVLAVSGLHIGIIYLILCWLVKPLEFYNHGKVLRISIIIFVLWFYAYFTGMSPSVSRAVLMFTFVVIGEVSGRRYASENALFASAFFLMLFNPYIIYEIGFQLSYLAVFGIFRLYKPIYDALYFKYKAIDKIWSLIALSIAAQIATTPLSLYYFHQFPTYFILSNLLIVPLVGLVIQGAFLFLVVGFYEPFSGFIAHMVNYLLKAMTTYSGWVVDFPFSLLPSIYVDPVTLIALYALMFFIYAMFQTHNMRLTIISSVGILLLLVYGCWNRIDNLKRYEMHVFNSYKSPVLFIDANRAFSISPDTTVDAQSFVNQLSMFYKTDLKLISNQVSGGSISVLKYKDIALLYGKDKRINYSEIPINDYSIILGNSPILESLDANNRLILNLKKGYFKVDLNGIN